MRALHRSLPLLAALVLLGLALAFALLAVDVRAWQHTVAHDDLRFHTRYAQTPLWQPPAMLPGDPAGALLGVGESIAYRHALQRFWFEEIGTQKANGADLTAARVETQTLLQSLTTGARTAAERSIAANLLGLMTITTTTNDHASLAQAMERAAAYFRLAIADDPANWPAKVDLELVFRLKHPGKSHFGADARGGFGSGGLQGAGVVGGGY